MNIEEKLCTDMRSGKFGFQASEFDTYATFETAIAIIRGFIADGIVEEIDRGYVARKLDVVLLRPIALERLP